MWKVSSQFRFLKRPFLRFGSEGARGAFGRPGFPGDSDNILVREVVVQTVMWDKTHELEGINLTSH